MYLAQLRNWCKLIKNYFWNYFQFRLYVLHIHLSTCIMWLNVSSEMQHCQFCLSMTDWKSDHLLFDWLRHMHWRIHGYFKTTSYIYMCWWDLKGELLKNALSIFIQQMQLSDRICCCLITVRYVQIKIHPWLEKLKNFLLK